MDRAGDRGGPDLTAREGRFFDRLVAEAGDFNPFTERGWGILARRFAEEVPAQGAGLSLLDVGCGTGRSQAVYREHSARYTGIDLSLASLALARRRDPASRWLQADACRLPFGDESFDAVAFSSVLHHLSTPHPALAEARRVLRPGGWVFAFDPNLLHPAMALFRHPKSPFYRSEGVSPDERPLLPATLRAWFRDAGFVEPGQRCKSGIPYRQVAPRGLDALLPLYNRLDQLWEKVGLGRWLGSFVVTWGRKP
jgi:ubiquinone/menaquinone biosynthesis C-methylase UbiE